MHKYELNWIVHTMAEDIFNRCEAQTFLPRLIPEQYKTYQLDTLQLHAIYKRMNLELLPDEYEMTEVSMISRKKSVQHFAASKIWTMVIRSIDATNECK